jgi:RNA polymerase sigma factor (sigma-70 family)
LTEGINDKLYWESVWERFKSGDKEAFAFLYNRYVDVLFHYGCKLSKDEEMVKDAIQEVFIDLYNGRERNNTSPENLKYYLILAIKRNLIKKLVRGRCFDIGKVKDKLVFDPPYNVESQLIELENHRELVERVSGLLNQLTHKQKEAIYLRFNESLDYAEVAEIMGITIESVRKQVYRAIKQMKEILDSKNIVIFFYFLLKKS